jgi:hypothetical protein
MLREPKAKFLVSPHKKAFEGIVTSPAFEEATLAALLQLQAEFPRAPDPAGGWDQASQLHGARRYLDILCNLCKPNEEPKRQIIPVLDEKAGV